MFCLGRADSWASGDLALQLAVQSALRLKAKPTSQELEDIAERWRPWRAVAAGLMWAYYAHARQASAAASELRATSVKNLSKTGR